MNRHVIRFGLRGRFIAAILVAVSVSTAGFYLALAQFIELYERESLIHFVGDRLEEFADDYRRDPATVGPQRSGFRSYVAAENDLSPLPPILEPVGVGLHEGIKLDHVEYAVGRTDVAGTRLYVLLSQDSIEEMEDRFVVLAWICAIASWTAAVLIAMWLAGMVLRPVSALATIVGNLDPAQRVSPLTGQFGDKDIGLIATAFDRFLERLDEFVGREKAFTEDASHELRTPLAVVDSAAQLLDEETGLSPLNRERVQRILRGTQQMQSLIEALLFLAREDGGVAMEELNLDQLVQEAAEGQREIAVKKNLSFEVHLQPVGLQAPRGMAICVINNLLLNAIHFTDRGRIDVRLEPARLIVQDTGIGIPPANLDRIFERRYRSVQSRGQGLGLYLVKRICDRLGWAVTVASSPGVGTRFEVAFKHLSQRKTNVLRTAA